MTYALVGIVAFIITIIVNFNVLFVKSTKNFTKPIKAYRLFIITILIFFLTDLLWGFFEHYKLGPVLYANTMLFFLTISISVFFWVRYTIIYIDGKGKTNVIVSTIGLIILAAIIALLIVNIFHPIVFKFDENYVYDTLDGRNWIYISQDVLYLLITCGSLFETIHIKDKTKRNRYYVISLFSFSMALSILVQILFPLLPLYSMGLVVGICLVNTFVVNSEKEENRNKLEDLLKKEIENQKELNSTRELVYTDSLTGAYSKYAYVEAEDKIDKLIAKKLISNFSVVVFDINGLKYINDTLGHQAGDKYIKDCYKLITDIFKNNRVYRFGGDEFVVILQGNDYEKREELLMKFDSIIDDNLLYNKPVVSTGMSDFNLDIDNTYRAVFVRADELMYERKTLLKSRGSHAR